MIFLEKTSWNEQDFELLGWHDCHLYSLTNDYINYKLILDIDYILKWERSSNEIIGFWIAPSDLIFHNYSFFEIKILNKQTSDLIISNITKKAIGKSPNLKYDIYEFVINLNNENFIKIKATGFTQKIRKNPIFSENQDLGSLSNR